MPGKINVVQHLAVGLALALVVSISGACQGNAPGSTSGSPVKGGTLHITNGDDVDYLDTADAYSPVSWALERAYARTLYAYQSSADPGKAGTPAPDLATGPPTVTGNGTIYTFTLRQGVKWAPPVNRALKAQDFVYGLARMFDSKTPSSGQPYALFIKGADAFATGKATTISGIRAVDDQTSPGGPLQRSDESLSAGQIAEGAGLGELAGVGDARAPLQPEPQIGAVRAGDSCLRSRRQQLGDRPALSSQPFHVSAHQPGEHLLAHPGQGRHPRAGVGGGLARGGVGKRLDGGRQNNVHSRHRGGDRRRWLGRVRGALGHHRQHRIGPGVLGLVAHPLADPLGDRVADHQHRLALQDPEAVADDRADRLIELAHRPAA